MRNFVVNPARLFGAGLVVLLGGALLAPSAYSQLPPPSTPDIQIAQVFDPRLRQNEPKIIDLKADETAPKRVKVGESLVVGVTVTNVGNLPAGFQYALGSADRSAIWATAPGKELNQGESHRARLTLPYNAAYTRFTDETGRRPQGGPHEVCFGVFLLAPTSQEHFRDMNNANHQKKHCLTFEFVIN